MASTTPTRSTVQPPPLVLRPLILTVGIGALWFILAWRSPSSTHHFAPLVTAGAWGFISELGDRRATFTAAIGGVVVALAALVALALADRLGGPTLWGARPSWPELVGFAVLGGLITLWRGRSHVLS
ncbi:MAG: hypothetical protein GY724_02290 [Actinomycetia bacterium]|nr:hypothetical protein [Actinomycetes bacterium]MCP4224010.1 hypothetical protein [Actinomycetes bacterium]MCP5031543.1 hypothetical protein [Actinomycetes bacterium]